MVNRETITVNVATIEQCDVTGSLSVFIEDMKSYLDGVPQEYRAAVEIEMERGDPEWGDPAQLVISYERPETDSEYQKRAGDIRPLKRPAFVRPRRMSAMCWLS